MNRIPKLNDSVLTRALFLARLHLHLLDRHADHGQRRVSGVDEVLVERLDLPVRQPEGHLFRHKTHVVLVPSEWTIYNFWSI